MKSRFKKGHRVLQMELRIPSVGDRIPRTFRFATFGSVRLSERDFDEYAKATGYHQAVHQLFDIAENGNRTNKNIPESKRSVQWWLCRCLSVAESRRKLKRLEREQRQSGRSA